VLLLLCLPIFFVCLATYYDAVTVGCISGWHGWCRQCAWPLWFVGCRCDYSSCWDDS